MADIAGIFHWPLSELQSLPIDDLTRWHGRAVKWWNRHHARKD